MAQDHEFQQQKALDYSIEEFQLPPNDARMKSSSHTQTSMSMSQVISEMLKALKRQSDFLPISQTIVANTPNQLVLNAQARTYLIVQNNDAAATVYFGVGFSPSASLGIQIIPGGFYEPYQVPQGDIFLNASANAQVTILYASDILPDTNALFG